MTVRTGVLAICLALSATVPATAAAAPPADTPKAPGSSLTVYHWWASVSEVAALNALLEVFKSQNPSVPVSPTAANAQGGGSRMFWLVNQATSAGHPPDVFQVHAGAPLRPYFEAGLLSQLDSVWTSSGLEKAVPPMIRNICRIEGRYYSLPINVHRNNVIWYNKALLDKYGVDPGSLTTWEALFKAAEKLKAAGLRTPVQIGESWTLSVAFESIMAGLGIGAYESWVNGKLTAGDDPRLVEAFGILKSYLSYANADRASLAWDVAIKRLIRGETAFCIMGDWANGEFQLAKLKFGKDYGALPVPGTKGMYGVTVDAFAQTRGIPNPANSNRWMSVAASREGQDAFNAAKGSISARADADPSRYDAYQRSAIADFKAARSIYPNMTSATHDAFKNGLDNIMTGFSADLDAAKAAAAVASAAAQSQNRFRQQWSLQ
jgi:glucose/mannose transport system substrate-binding protein